MSCPRKTFGKLFCKVPLEKGLKYYAMFQVCLCTLAVFIDMLPLNSLMSNSAYESNSAAQTLGYAFPSLCLVEIVAYAALLAGTWDGITKSLVLLHLASHTPYLFILLYYCAMVLFSIREGYLFFRNVIVIAGVGLTTYLYGCTVYFYVHDI